MEAFKQFSSCKAATKLFEVLYLMHRMLSCHAPTHKNHHWIQIKSIMSVIYSHTLTSNIWTWIGEYESEAQKSISGMSSLFLLLFILKSFVYLDIVAWIRPSFQSIATRGSGRGCSCRWRPCRGRETTWSRWSLLDLKVYSCQLKQNLTFCIF